MRGIHGKYMAYGRDAKLVFVSQIQAVEAIDELGAVGHGDLLRMTVEDVQGHSTKHRVPQSRNLFQLVAWSYFAAGAIPGSPLINDKFDGMARIGFSHDMPMPVDERFHVLPFAQQLIPLYGVELESIALALYPVLGPSAAYIPGVVV